mmetsp:Transcript_61909/g.182878  ORF Transcript_61909/g.182878 Transcript_61909/m.182878 type:complete len:294 (+) Transcript_61909:60-941(+)
MSFQSAELPYPSSPKPLRLSDSLPRPCEAVLSDKRPHSTFSFVRSSSYPQSPEAYPNRPPAPSAPPFPSRRHPPEPCPATGTPAWRPRRAWPAFSPRRAYPRPWPSIRHRPCQSRRRPRPCPRSPSREGGRARTPRGRNRRRGRRRRRGRWPRISAGSPESPGSPRPGRPSRSLLLPRTPGGAPRPRRRVRPLPPNSSPRRPRPPPAVRTRRIGWRSPSRTPPSRSTRTCRRGTPSPPPSPPTPPAPKPWTTPWPIRASGASRPPWSGRRRRRDPRGPSCTRPSARPSTSGVP